MGPSPGKAASHSCQQQASAGWVLTELRPGGQRGSLAPADRHPLLLWQVLDSASLVPKGTPKVQRRARIPDKPNYSLNLWSIMKNCIGRELSKIPMPVGARSGRAASVGPRGSLLGHAWGAVACVKCKWPQASFS